MNPKKTPSCTTPIKIKNLENILGSFLYDKSSNGSNSGNKVGFGDGYKYPHDFENQFANQDFLPKEIDENKFYEPANNTKEESIRKFLKTRWRDKYNY